MIWTEALSARIADLWRYRSAAEIAEVLRSQGFNVSRNAVIGRIHRLKLTVKDKSEVHPSTNMTVEPRPKVAAPKVKQSRRSTAAGPQVQKINAAQRAMRGLGAAQVQSINRGPATAGDGYKPKTVEVASLDIRLVDLEPIHCRFTCSRVDDEWRFCGHPRMEGSSYCQAHHDLCWTPRLAAEKQKPFYRNDGRRAA